MIERIFGANWRTTLSGWGAAISSLIAFLAMANTDLGGFIPEQYKGKIALASAIAAFALKVINSLVSKDAAVSGIGTMEQPHTTPDTSGTRSQLIPIMLALLVIPCLTACNTIPIRASVKACKDGNCAVVGYDGKAITAELEYNGK